MLQILYLFYVTLPIHQLYEKKVNLKLKMGLSPIAKYKALNLYFECNPNDVICVTPCHFYSILLS